MNVRHASEFMISSCNSLKFFVNPFLPTVPQVEHSILAKIAKKFGQKWVNQKNEIFVGSHISKFFRPAQRYDDFKPISPNFFARRSVMMILNLSESLAKPLVMAKLNMAKPSKTAVVLIAGVKTAVVLIAGVTISGTPCPRHIIVPLVPKHLRATWPRPEQSHLLPEACSPNGTDNRQQRQRRTKRPPPEPIDILKRFYALYDDKLRYYMNKVFKLNCVLNPFLPTVPQVEHSILAKIAKKFGQKWVNQKNEIFVGSHISKFLRPAQRYDDFKLIRITCQAACHGKTEHGIFVKFKKPSKTAVVFIADCQV